MPNRKTVREPDVVGMRRVARPKLWKGQRGFYFLLCSVEGVEPDAAATRAARADAGMTAAEIKEAEDDDRLESWRHSFGSEAEMTSPDGSTKCLCCGASVPRGRFVVEAVNRQDADWPAVYSRPAASWPAALGHYVLEHNYKPSKTFRRYLTRYFDRDVTMFDAKIEERFVDDRFMRALGRKPTKYRIGDYRDTIVSRVGPIVPRSDKELGAILDLTPKQAEWIRRACVRYQRVREYPEIDVSRLDREEAVYDTMRRRRAERYSQKKKTAKNRKRAKA